jgi:antiviral helicase SLH1
MYAPKFPKKQTEGFFVLVSRQGNGELLALKRVAWPTNGPRKKVAKVRISLLENTVASKLQVLTMSDGYIRLEWELSEVVIPPAPQPDVVTKS